jgi:hypothetical protein
MPGMPTAGPTRKWHRVSLSRRGRLSLSRVPHVCPRGATRARLLLQPARQSRHARARSDRRHAFATRRSGARVPLTPPSSNRALTRCHTENPRESARCHSDSTTLRVPPVCPAVQTVQTGSIGRGSQMVQIEVGGGNRCVSHPCLYGHRINSAGQPETGCRMPQIMDATAMRDGGPRRCSLECRGVQSVTPRR